MISISSLFEISFGLLTRLGTGTQNKYNEAMNIQAKMRNQNDASSSSRDPGNTEQTRNNLFFANKEVNNAQINNNRVDEMKNRMNMRSQPDYKSSAPYERSNFITSQAKKSLSP
jgi:hypothetical protein